MAKYRITWITGCVLSVFILTAFILSVIYIKNVSNLTMPNDGTLLYSYSLKCPENVTEYIAKYVNKNIEEQYLLDTILNNGCTNHVYGSDSVWLMMTYLTLIFSSITLFYYIGTILVNIGSHTPAYHSMTIGTFYKNILIVLICMTLACASATLVFESKAHPYEKCMPPAVFTLSKHINDIKQTRIAKLILYESEKRTLTNLFDNVCTGTYTWEIVSEIEPYYTHIKSPLTVTNIIMNSFRSQHVILNPVCITIVTIYAIALLMSIFMKKDYLATAIAHMNEQTISQMVDIEAQRPI